MPKVENYKSFPPFFTISLSSSANISHSCHPWFFFSPFFNFIFNQPTIQQPRTGSRTMKLKWKTCSRYNFFISLTLVSVLSHFCLIKLLTPCLYHLWYSRSSKKPLKLWCTWWYEKFECEYRWVSQHLR